MKAGNRLMNALFLRTGRKPKFRMLFALISLSLLIVAGCGNQKDFDPKALSGGDSPEMKQANSSMEDFMKTQGKPKSK